MTVVHHTMADKPVLIILPGWGGTKETWRDFTELAKDFFDIQVIDLPCFGEEPCPKEAWGIEDYSNFVKSKIINHKPARHGLARGMAGGSKIILLGHSFGGQVAAYFAAQNPEMISKLILIAPALFRKKRGLRRLFFGIIAKTGHLIFKLPIIEKFDVWAKKILYKAADSPDYAKTSGIKREIFKKIIRQDLKDILPKIKVPTLLIQGTLDKYVPVKDSKKAANLIPNSKLELISLGRHGLHFQQPKKLLSIISQYALGD
jgi:pimeloyl-ACP methyl ester carboxylesterase